MAPGAGQPLSISRRAATVAILGVVGLVAALVVARVVTGGPAPAPPLAAGTGTGAGAAPAAALVSRRVAGVPRSTIVAVGAGTANPLTRIDAPALRAGGKPLVLYIGAEFCPYCAGERWAIVNALSRFGRFAGLRLTHSASDEAYANTPTFSFYRSTYTSRYVAFQGVEVRSNRRDASGQYATLQPPTAAQRRAFETYDAPPYVSSDVRGSIPFLVLGGRSLLVGGQYLPESLQGRTHGAIASALADPDTAQARAVVGGANWITAALCRVTGDRPASACSPRVIQQLATRQDARG
jgi:hypothetical protein